MNILLLTDFSVNARNAAEYAFQLFRSIPCTFHFLHVTPVKGKREDLSLPPEIQSKFDFLLDWANRQKLNSNHEFTVSYRCHYFIEAVRELAKEKKIDLILMGTRGSSNSKDLFVGKNAEDVMRKVKYPVLAVSENAVYHPRQQMLLPTDYKVRCTLQMLKVLSQLSQLSQSKVQVLELLSSGPPTFEQLENRKFLLESCDFQLSDLNKVTPTLSSENKIMVMVAKNLGLWRSVFRSNRNSSTLTAQSPLLVLH